MNKEGLIVFLVVGRLPKALTLSKVEPIANSSMVSRIFIFQRETGYMVSKSRYITLSRFIMKIKPKIILVIFRELAEFFQLLYYTLKYRPDVINAIGLLPSGFISYIVSITTGTKSIVSVIGGVIEIPTYHRFKAFWKRLNLRMLKKCSALTTTGSNISNYLINNGVKKEKIFEYPGGIDNSRFYLSTNERDIDILFVGAFRRLKGPDRVLHIVENLLHDFPYIKACFLGEGYLFESILEMVRIKNMEHNVKLMGQIRNPEAYFQRAKLLLMPSRSEGLSMAMLEAMACGCVPIVSNVGNMIDAAIHGKTAMVVDDYMNIELFTNYAKELISDRKKREFLSQNAQQLVMDRFTITEQQKIYEQMLVFVIGMDDKYNFNEHWNQ